MPSANAALDGGPLRNGYRFDSNPVGSPVDGGLPGQAINPFRFRQWLDTA